VTGGAVIGRTEERGVIRLGVRPCLRKRGDRDLVVVNRSQIENAV
jgi:hypothetical protein